MMPQRLLAFAVAASVLLCRTAAGQNDPPFDPARPPPLTELVSLVPVPQIDSVPSAPLTPQESANIRQLIDALTSIDRPDFGLSATLTAKGVR